MDDWDFDVGTAVKQIRALVEHAESPFFNLTFGGSANDDITDAWKSEIEWYIESAFLQSLLLFEILGLDKSYERMEQILVEARADGFAMTEMGPDGPMLKWPPRIHRLLSILTPEQDEPTRRLVMRDLSSILRASTYAITDAGCFDAPPQNETEVHKRIEAVLRCVFPDLITKPALTKPIKHFQPDTGIPSLRTLLEYKFVQDAGAAKRVVDEILADTRGYKNEMWDHSIFVIYETRRVKPEAEWKQLLADCGTKEYADIIVLHGEQSGGSATTPNSYGRPPVNPVDRE